MKCLAAFLTVALLSSTPAEPFRLSLEDVPVGRLPPGWTAAKTGEGPGSVWKVVEDATAPGGKALAQTSAEGPQKLFNLCVSDKVKFRDLDASVKFKAVAGQIDQGGGLVWQYRDRNNYYLARMNPLEDNYRVYKVVGGKRTQLATADLTAAVGWHTLRVIHAGNHIVCQFDGKPFLDVKDDTFREAGKIGLWTKADAQTRFADLRVTPQTMESDPKKGP
jgi:hypothetical protein